MNDRLTSIVIPVFNEEENLAELFRRVSAAAESLPGDYEVTVKEIRGGRRTVKVSVAAGETVERMVDPAGGE